MKKILLSIVAVAFSTTMLSQEFVVKVCEDKIEKTTTYIPTESIFVKSPSGKDGFLLSLYIQKKEDKIVCTGITVNSVVGSSCVENSTLYLVLENDEVVTLTAWNKFNCDATSYFDFTDENIKKISTIKLKTIRFKNGYDSTSLTGIEKGKELFFVRAVNNMVLKNVNCD